MEKKHMKILDKHKKTYEKPKGKNTYRNPIGILQEPIDNPRKT